MASSAAAQRREKRQRQRQREREKNGASFAQQSAAAVGLPEGVEVEYVSAPVVEQHEHEEHPQFFDQFSRVIARFTAPALDDLNEQDEQGETLSMERAEGEGRKQPDRNSDDEDAHGAGADPDGGTDGTLSKKKLKRLSRMKLADLKQYARHPEAVEWEDVTSKDPKLLVQLKAARHTVPVPRHWNQKRKYLAGKRGYVKPPFDLPSFIRDTGITELRDTVRAQDSAKRTKVKAREKMHPKLGRISVDYERLYDAFFKFQTKPPLTAHGELYYEGREFEGRQDKKPGFLSEELRAALSMVNHLMPPPWLHSMQKYGPPPSYPHMRIPGLNAPIPEGAQWGYHPGGWGKPPVDNFMRDMPTRSEDPVQTMLLNPVERNIWGELEPDDEEPSEEIAPEPEAPHELVLDEEQAENYRVPPAAPAVEYRPAETPSYISDTPEVVELRKNRRHR